MSEQYTPTTEEVREWTAFGRLRGGIALLDPYQRREAFDRWLAQHEAAIRRDQIEKVIEAIEPLLGGSFVASDGYRAYRVTDDKAIREVFAALRAQIGDTECGR